MVEVRLNKWSKRFLCPFTWKTFKQKKKHILCTYAGRVWKVNSSNCRNSVSLNWSQKELANEIENISFTISETSHQTQILRILFPYKESQSTFVPSCIQFNASNIWTNIMWTVYIIKFELLPISNVRQTNYHIFNNINDKVHTTYSQSVSSDQNTGGGHACILIWWDNDITINLDGIKSGIFFHFLFRGQSRVRLLGEIVCFSITVRSLSYSIWNASK